MAVEDAGLLARLWGALGGDPEDVRAIAVTGPERLLPSVYDVTGLATAAVGCATLAAAQLWAHRTGTPTPAVGVDRRGASLAFAAEAYFQPIGWSVPPVWDPVAGDYEAADGWIRLHTNYRHHRAAVVRVLGVGASRAAVAAQVAQWPADRLETAVVEAGGCAAAMHDRSTWLSRPAGRAGAAEPLGHWVSQPAETPFALAEGPAGEPFAGVRVLDLTRVIAGPVATRFLAGYGAEVLRIDPRGFEEVPALLPEMTLGKHCAALDLTQPSDRDTFERLLADAHVLVSGLRSDALTRLGYDTDALRAINPGLITASHNAYGWTGPWRARRGFDSLVQMSCGIAAAGAAALTQGAGGSTRPVPLPAQALDHATGYLMAAAVGTALRRLLTEGVTTQARLSLIGTANILMDAPVPDGRPDARPAGRDDDLRAVDTEWGPARHIPLPGAIAGVQPQWTVHSGPLGRHPARWPSSA